ncbi:hypothetical protein [Paenirhodobacter populi]|uniref:hypothetical protein n=1 Tax=Paenirhodobacter populi TaxID=2306993 RepID=UPI000FE32677|nr:hypothetical protein [Sinirhodobacter populi]
MAILIEELKAGKIHFSSHLHAKMSASVDAIRIKPDGTVDLSTVDASVRSMAFMSSIMRDREDMKAEISIYEINKMFYDFLELNMGWLIKGAKERGMDAHEVGLALSSSAAYVENIIPSIRKCMEMLDDFWESLTAVCQYHLQDFDGLKAVFGGDLFPSYQQNIASSSGLYLDVIALNDPFSKSRHVFESGSYKQAVYIFAKHVINLMDYKELALCDEHMPLVAIVPPTKFDESNREWLGSMIRSDTTKHLSTAFGRTFNDIDEVEDFLKGAAEPEDLVKLIVRKEMILFDVEWEGDLLAQMKRAMANTDLRVASPTHAGRFLTGIIFGRMGQATDILQRSRDFGSIPLLDAPTSWRYFNFALAHQSTDNLAYDRKELHMVHGLQRAAATDAEWLGNIPPSALIEMRKQGAMPEIREMLSKGISEIAVANPDGFYRTADQVVANVQEAFDLHKQNIEALKKKRWKFLGHDIGGWLVTGSLEIGAAVLGTPAIGLGALVAQNAFDLPKLKDLPKRNRETKSALDYAKRSPIGLLFSHGPK